MGLLACNELGLLCLRGGETGLELRAALLERSCLFAEAGFLLGACGGEGLGFLLVRAGELDQGFVVLLELFVAGDKFGGERFEFAAAFFELGRERFNLGSAAGHLGLTRIEAGFAFLRVAIHAFELRKSLLDAPESLGEHRVRRESPGGCGLRLA